MPVSVDSTDQAAVRYGRHRRFPSSCSSSSSSSSSSNNNNSGSSGGSSSGVYLERHNNNNNSPADDAGDGKCVVCLDTFAPSKLLLLHGHRDICSDCFVLLLRSRLGPHAITAMRQCYRPLCTSPLTLDDIKRNTPPLHPDIAHEIEHACKTHTKVGSSGTAAGTLAMTRCITDEELQRINCNMRLCPGCQVPVERNGGCYHVMHQCTPTQRTDFCITCGTILDCMSPQLEFLSRTAHFPAGFYSPCVVASTMNRYNFGPPSSPLLAADDGANDEGNALLYDEPAANHHLETTLVLETAQLARISNVYCRKLQEIRASFLTMFWVVLLASVLFNQTKLLFYITLYIVYAQVLVVALLFGLVAMAVLAGGYFTYYIVTHILMAWLGMGVLVALFIVTIAVGAHYVHPNRANALQLGAMLYGRMTIRAAVSIFWSLRLFNFNVHSWANRAVLPFFIAWQLRAVYSLSNLRAQILLQRSHANLPRDERNQFVALCAWQELLELSESFVHSPKEHRVPWYGHYLLVSIFMYHLYHYIEHVVRLYV